MHPRTNVENIYRDTKIPSIDKVKFIMGIKNYQACKEAGKYGPKYAIKSYIFAIICHIYAIIIYIYIFREGALYHLKVN